MYLRFLITVTVLLVPLSVWGQEEGHVEGAARTIQGPFFPCTLTTDHVEAVVAGDGAVRSRLESNMAGRLQGREATADFDVTYTGFTPEAQAAFQYAVDLWATSIESSVTIRIDARYEDLGNANVLGRAGTNTFHRNFPGAPKPNPWYVDALSDALRGTDSAPGDPDIVAHFNSAFDNWYFGLDGNPPGDQFDFVSVVLHELGHGLGFHGSASVEEGTGNGKWGLATNTGDLFPMVFDLPVEDLEGTPLLDEGTYPNPSPQLGGLLTSENVYIDTPGVLSTTDGERGKLYAPASWRQGSSYSHWDQATYTGTDNALMTPSIAPGVIHHRIGPITCGFFEDMGWMLGPGCLAELPPRADLSLATVLETEDPYVAGQEVEYSLTVSNAGPSSATNIEVTDTPTNLTFTEVSGACLEFPCTIAGPLAADDSTTITVVATIDEAGAFDNAATVEGEEDDRDPDNNTANDGDIADPPIEEFALELDGPHPVRTSTLVRVLQPEAGAVHAALYDVMGRQVEILHDDEAQTMLPLQINRDGLAAGMYLLDVRTEDEHETLRITFL